ncbi:MAG: hypothetical protein Q8M94_01320, partial [Ignavibacteria bacterium]|nr:hypothetical protein [Ignavibacteria bacterium]
DIIEIKALTDVVEPMGNETFIYFEVEKIQFIARVKPSKELRVGEKIKLFIDSRSVYFFDKKTGNHLFNYF